MNYIFKREKSKITKNHTGWTFAVMFQEFGSKNVNDKPKYQRPDIDGAFLLFGEGNIWQKQLMADIIKGNPFQPIHLRFNKNGIWEIVDGGHRTRTVYKFLNGFVRLPENTILKDEDGAEFDISNMNFGDILKTYPFLKDYIWNELTFEVYEYREISDKTAEELFLKLNDLNEMSPADKRNSIDNIIADICRERGAIDSPIAIDIFKDTTQKGKNRTLAHASIPLTKRCTDEMVSFALYYLYSGGVFSDSFNGMESQKELNTMYRDEELIKRLQNPKDTLLSDLDSLLKIINDVVKEGRLSTIRNGIWAKGSIKKLIMLATEAARNAGGFMKYKPDAVKLHTLLKSSYVELVKSKVAHHPYQRYQIINNTITPLPRDKQPKNVKYHETYQFPSVFTGGARVDDLLYIYYQFVSKGVFEFGLKTTTKDNVRSFSKSQNEIMWVEQQGRCKKCDTDLNTTSYAADHILGHAYGGPTEIKNGQLLCTPCNNNKSGGMDIHDVKYLCEKYESNDFDGISKYILNGVSTLNESQIKRIKQIVIG